MPEYNVRNPRQGDFDADINALKAADSQLLARIAAMERANAQPSPAVTNTNNYVQASSSSGLTSVSLAMPSQFTLDNSPLTTNGVITVSLASQAANLLWASPDGASGIPTFRSLALADIPNLLVTGAKIANTTVTVGKLSATGTADSTTFLRGDGAWATPATSSSSTLNIVTASGTTYTATNTDDVVISTNASPITVTLPSASGFGKRRLFIKRTQSGGVSIVRAGSDTIDGATSFSRGGSAIPWSATTLVSDGTSAWYIE